MTMKTTVLLILISIASLAAPRITITDATVEKHFSLDRHAVASFFIENSTSEQIETSQDGIISLKDRQGRYYSAGFEMKSLKPVTYVSGGFILKPKMRMTVRPDLTSLL